MTTISAGYTIADIRSINITRGFHFFDRGALRFFRSRILRSVYQGVGGIYFITSEQFVGSQITNQHSDPRMFTVRSFNPETGEVHTWGAFNAIRTASVARTIAKHAAKGDVTASTCFAMLNRERS